MNKIIHGDCIEVMKGWPDDCVDSVVTDPPYGLVFMGKRWDRDIPGQEVWEECLRVLKPGGHLLCFAGTRTQHRMAVNIEDAGFEVRDMLAWVYGSGFPKNHNIGKAVDKLQGNKRDKKLVPTKKGNSKRLGEGKQGSTYGDAHGGFTDIGKGTSEWEGWGTALKPALEPITLARKPISEKNIASNVLKWGTGGLNVDGCRVKLNGEEPPKGSAKRVYKANAYTEKKIYGENKTTPQLGRFPANFIHDGSEEVVGLFPKTKSRASVRGHNDSGSAARYFKQCNFRKDELCINANRLKYCAKASKAERNMGCEGMEEIEVNLSVRQNTRCAICKRFIRADYGEKGCQCENPVAGEVNKTFSKNHHPTVKPLALMKYLVRLVTPPGGLVLDPFIGSGTTAMACKAQGFGYIGIEKDEEYIEIARARIKAIKTEQKGLFQ